MDNLASQNLSWDEPVVFTEEHAHGYRSAELVAPSDARDFFRRRLLKNFSGYGAVMFGSAAIGGVLWWLWPDVRFLRNVGVVLVAGGLVRLAFAGASALEEWLHVPPTRGGRVEILPDRIRRTDHDGGTHEWSLAEIKFVQLETLNYGRNQQRQMVVRFPRSIRHEISLPDSISFEEIENVLARRGVPVRKPRRPISRRFGR